MKKKKEPKLYFNDSIENFSMGEVIVILRRIEDDGCKNEKKKREKHIGGGKQVVNLWFEWEYWREKIRFFFFQTSPTSFCSFEFFKW